MVCIRSEALIFDQWLKITEPVRKLKKLFIKFPLDGSLVDLFSGTPFFPFSVFFKQEWFISTERPAASQTDSILFC